MVQAIRDIYNFFYEKTGERYTKTHLSDCWTVFEKSSKELAEMESKAVIL